MRFLLLLGIAFTIFININPAGNPLYAQPVNATHTASAGIDITENTGGG